MEGVGDSLCSLANRYTYIISVPNMYNIVGREQVATLHSECWEEAWEAHCQQQSTRAVAKKKKEAENWEKAKREFDSIGGTPFNGVRAIAKKHHVCKARLKRYAERNMNTRVTELSATDVGLGPTLHRH